jgi:pSer/pThr/pTyr-binding forkhead associated (FHA) protein
MGLSILILGEGGDARGEPPRLIFDAPRIVIGRGDGCEVRLPDPSVSGRHASLRQHGGSFLLVDEGSTNGTFLGEVRLSPHAPRVIESGARVRVGRVWLELRVEVVAQSSSPHDTREMALMLVQRALDAAGGPAEPRLVVVEGPDQGSYLPLLRPNAPLFIGRGHGVDLALEEADASRRHVQVVRKAEQVFVRDLGSKNGTLLSGQRLPPDRDFPFRPGDELRIGQDRIRYENPALEALVDLERCADEPMAEGESIQAPADALPLTPLPEGAEGEPATAASPVAPAAPAPQAPVVAPLSVAHRRAMQRRTGWGASDVVIVLVALGVLALSLGGLWLVFR